eukprot:gene24320-9926_t
MELARDGCAERADDVVHRLLVKSARATPIDFKNHYGTQADRVHAIVRSSVAAMLPSADLEKSLPFIAGLLSIVHIPRHPLQLGGDRREAIHQRDGP